MAQGWHLIPICLQIPDNTEFLKSQEGPLERKKIYEQERISFLYTAPVQIALFQLTHLTKILNVENHV